MVSAIVEFVIVVATTLLELDLFRLDVPKLDLLGSHAILILICALSFTEIEFHRFAW